ncbi:LCP family protein [Candidatus Gracilibacteria bacterium]|nr:LCP family protein [Candidatus Gracilibacteria bacterium]
MFFQKKIGDNKKIKLNLEKSIFSKSFFDKTNIRQNFLSRIKNKKKSFYKIYFYTILFLIIFSSAKIIFGIYDFTASELSKKFFQPVFTELKKDKNGYVNILLIGAGGGDHEGADLTDTIILASFDFKTKKVTMLSIPRDFFVNYNPRYKSSRINEIMRDMTARYVALGLDKKTARKQARNALIKAIEKITNVDIGYYLQIDFKGFEKLVDAIGGITVEVEKTLVDTAYPDGNRGYETFAIEKGIHNLDGKTALKYARSRHSTSDFDRAKRQQLVLDAIKEKALSSEILVNPYKIKKILKIISENFETNLSFGDLFTLANYAGDFNKKSILNFVLNDDWNTAGGFLGTPPRADYGGAFILIPYSGESNFSRIQIFTDLIFNNRELTQTNFEVLNGTNWGGVASKASKRLERYGFKIENVGNSKENLKKTQIIFYNSKIKSETFKKFWDEIFPGVDIEFVDKIGYYEETNIDVSIILGSNFKL